MDEMNAAERYRQLLNSNFGTNYASGDDLTDFSTLEGAGDLSGENKSVLGTWYNAYLQSKSTANSYDKNVQQINQNAYGDTLQANKVADIVQKYLGVNNKANGLQGLGIADSTQIRAANDYQNALAQVNSQRDNNLLENSTAKENSILDIYRQAVNDQSTIESEWDSYRQGKQDEITNYTNVLNEAIGLYGDGSGKSAAEKYLENIYGGTDSQEYSAITAYLNTLDELEAEKKANWFESYSEASNDAAVNFSGDIRGEGDYTIGESIYSSDGKQWKVNAKYWGDDTVKKFITLNDTTKTDGNIVRGSNGKFYMAIGGMSWVEIEPVRA